MPFKPSTAKKYARLILQWMLPTAFALIVLNGAYRGFTVGYIPNSFAGMYYIISTMVTIVVVGCLIFSALSALLDWVYEVDQD